MKKHVRHFFDRKHPFANFATLCGLIPENSACVVRFKSGVTCKRCLKLLGKKDNGSQR